MSPATKLASFSPAESTIIKTRSLLTKPSFFQAVKSRKLLNRFKVLISIHDYRTQRVMLLYADSSDEEEIEE